MFGKKQTTQIGFNPFSKRKQQKPGVTTKIIDKISQWFREKLNPSSCIQREIVQSTTILVPINYEIIAAQAFDQDSVQIYKSQSSNQQKRNKFTTFNEYLKEEEQLSKVPLKQQLKDTKLKRKEKESAYENVLLEDMNVPKSPKSNDNREKQKNRRVSHKLYKKRKLNGKQMHLAVKYKERFSVVDQIQDSINESGILVVQQSDDSLKNNSLLVDIQESKDKKEEIILPNQKEEKIQENQPPILQIDQIVESHSKGMKKSQSMINIINDDGKSSPKKIEPSRKQSLKNEEQHEEKKPEKQEQPKQEEQKQVEQPRSLINFIVSGTEKIQPPNDERTNVSDTPLFCFGKIVENQKSQLKVTGASLFPSIEKKEQSQQLSSDSVQQLQANLFTFCQTKPKIDNSESFNQPQTSLTNDSSSSAQGSQQPLQPEVKPLFGQLNKEESLQIKQGTQSLFANLLNQNKEQKQGEQGISKNSQPDSSLEKKPEQNKSNEGKTLFGDLFKKDSLFSSLISEKVDDSKKVSEPLKTQDQTFNLNEKLSEKQPLPAEENNKDIKKQETISLFNNNLTKVQDANSLKTDKPSLFSQVSQVPLDDSQPQPKPAEKKISSLLAKVIFPPKASSLTNDETQPKLLQNFLNKPETDLSKEVVPEKDSNQQQTVPSLFNFTSGLLQNTKPIQETPKSTENNGSESKQELKTPTLNQIGLNCQWKSSDEQKQNSSQNNKIEEKNAEKVPQKEEQKSSPFSFLIINKQNNESIQQSSDFSQKSQVQTPKKPIDNPFLQQSPKLDSEQIKSYFSQSSSSSQAINLKSIAQTSNFADTSSFQPQQKQPSLFGLPPQQLNQIQPSLFKPTQTTSMFFQQQQQQPNQFIQEQHPQQQNSQLGNGIQSFENKNAMTNEIEIGNVQKTQQNFKTSLFSSVIQQPQQEQINSFNQQPTPFQMQPQQQNQQMFGNTQPLFSFSQNNNDMAQQNQSKCMSKLGFYSQDGQKSGFQSGSLNSSFTSKQGKKKQRIGQEQK